MDITVKWRIIEAYPDYEVSNDGRVRKTTKFNQYPVGYELRSWLSNGYPTVDLCNSGLTRRFKIHRLVALAFVGLCQDGEEVNHKDGVKANNNVDNLEYVTRQGNAEHAAANGLLKYGAEHPLSVLTDDNVLSVRLRAAAGETQTSLASEFCVSVSTVHNIVSGKTWTSVGGPVRKVRKRGSLTADDVVEIRRRSSLGEAYKSIASDFSVGLLQICNVVARKHWAHVP